MTPTQENHALTSAYVKRWKEKYGHKPNVNVNKAQFGWKNMRLVLTLDEINEVVDFYFTLNDPIYKHDLHHFQWEYDKIVSKMLEVKKDREYRKQIAVQSEQRTKEFDERIARIKRNQQNSSR